MAGSSFCEGKAPPLHACQEQLGPISLGQPNCLRDHASTKLNFGEFNCRDQVVKINHMLRGSTVQIQELLGV